MVDTHSLSLYTGWLAGLGIASWVSRCKQVLWHPFDTTLVVAVCSAAFLHRGLAFRRDITRISVSCSGQCTAHMQRLRCSAGSSLSACLSGLNNVSTLAAFTYHGVRLRNKEYCDKRQAIVRIPISSAASSDS